MFHIMLAEFVLWAVAAQVTTQRNFGRRAGDRKSPALAAYVFIRLAAARYSKEQHCMRALCAAN